MGKSKKRKLEIHPFLFMYITFCYFVIINDFIQSVIQIQYRYSIIISLIVISVLLLLLLNKDIIGFDRNNFEKIDIIAIVAILLVSIIRIATPDSTFDIYNYHLYFQKNFGLSEKNFINDDFFPMRNMNAFCYVLGDRMFYIFRGIFGYRIGTILNSLILIGMYFQVKEILDYYQVVCERKKKWMRILVICCILFSENIIWEIDSYMIDLLALPFLIELFFLTVICEKEETPPIQYIAILSSLAGIMKLPNLLIVFVFLVFYIMRQKRNILSLQLVWSVLIAIAGFLPYFIYSLRLTGNPIFPYANGLFNSPYYSNSISPSDASNLNTRFGPKGILEYTLWPIVMILHPEKVCDIYLYTGRILIGIICMVYFLIAVQKGIVKENRLKRSMICWLLLYILYLTFFHGYLRYVIILELLTGIIIDLTVEQIFLNVKMKKKGWYIVISCLTFLQTGYLAATYFIQNYEWSFRDTAITDFSSYLDNMKLIGKDRETELESDVLDSIDGWLVFAYNGSALNLMKSDVPIVGMNASATNEYTSQLLNRKLNSLADKNIYTAIDKKNLELYISNIRESGYVIDDLSVVYPNFTSVNNPFYLMKVEEEEKENELHLFYLTYELEIDLSGDNEYHFFCGIDCEQQKGSVSVYAEKDGISELLCNFTSGDNNEIIIDNEITKQYEKIKIVQNTEVQSLNNQIPVFEQVISGQ